jgi:deazaflavin-dependent oxidoreductase (nitroreductase family)
LNPFVRLGFRIGLVARTIALLEHTGRTSGKTYRTPVGCGYADDAFWVIAERGLQADYVKNVRKNPDVRLKHRRRWHRGRATVLPDDDARARSRRLRGKLTQVTTRSNARFLGTTLVTVRIDPASDEPDPEQAT